MSGNFSAGSFSGAVGGFSVDGGPAPVVAQIQPDTHDGFGGYVNVRLPRDEKAHRLDREEVRRRLEAAFAQAAEALEPVAEIVAAQETTVTAETPLQLADIGVALATLKALDSLKARITKAEARQIKETRDRLNAAEEELALLMTLARMSWL